MKTCKQCGGFYTGDAFEGRCMTCYERWRMHAYRDPEEAGAWTKRQWQRIDALMHVLSDMELGVPRMDASGVCKVCERPLDEHKLTYSVGPYAMGQCAVSKPTPKGTARGSQGVK